MYIYVYIHIHRARRNTETLTWIGFFKLNLPSVGTNIHVSFCYVLIAFNSFFSMTVFLNLFFLQSTYTIVIHRDLPHSILFVSQTLDAKPRHVTDMKKYITGWYSDFPKVKACSVQL